MHMLSFLNLKIFEFWKLLAPNVLDKELRITFLNSGIHSCITVLKKENISEIMKFNIFLFLKGKN